MFRTGFFARSATTRGSRWCGAGGALYDARQLAHQVFVAVLWSRFGTRATEITVSCWYTELRWVEFNGMRIPQAAEGPHEVSDVIAPGGFDRTETRLTDSQRVPVRTSRRVEGDCPPSPTHRTGTPRPESTSVRSTRATLSRRSAPAHSSTIDEESASLLEDSVARIVRWVLTRRPPWPGTRRRASWARS